MLRCHFVVWCSVQPRWLTIVPFIIVEPRRHTWMTYSSIHIISIEQQMNNSLCTVMNYTPPYNHAKQFIRPSAHKSHSIRRGEKKLRDKIWSRFLFLLSLSLTVIWYSNLLWPFHSILLSQKSPSIAWAEGKVQREREREERDSEIKIDSVHCTVHYTQYIHAERERKVLEIDSVHYTVNYTQRQRDEIERE